MLLLSVGMAYACVQRRSGDAATADDSGCESLPVLFVQADSAGTHRPGPVVLGPYSILFWIADSSDFPFCFLNEYSSRIYVARSLWLTIWKDDKVILAEREFSRNSFVPFIPQNEVTAYSVSHCRVAGATPEGVTLEVNVCKPDTDICHLIALKVSAQGQVEMKELDPGPLGEKD